MKHSKEILSRAQGCLLGQLAGDALGSLVEFRSPKDISREYPHGVRYLADGGTWNTIAGQPTDDSEMALMLARTLVKQGRYDSEAAEDAYIFWLDSGPFDRGTTVTNGLARTAQSRKPGQWSDDEDQPFGHLWSKPRFGAGG